MAWITPKTNWKNTDKFAYTDYNRIRNNLLYINDVLNEKYPDKAQTLDLGNPLVYSSNYLPSQFNAFENALESFTRIGSNVNIGSKKIFKGNDAFIGFQELNRIEECCLRWYNYDPVIHVDSISISPASQTMSVGDTATFTVTCLPADAEDINDWRVNSSNTSILTVTKSGTNIIATAIGVGNATINVSIGSVSATASITVEAVLVNQIIVDKDNVQIPYSTNVNVGYTLLPSNASNKDSIVVVSSNINIVTVSWIGNDTIQLRGKSTGRATVTLKCGQASAIVNVNVLNIASRIWISSRRGGTSLNKSIVGGLGRTVTDYVVTEPIDAIDKNNFTYTNSNPQCISVTRNGDALSYTTLALGTSKITVTLDSGVDSWELEVEVV